MGSSTTPAAWRSWVMDRHDQLEEEVGQAQARLAANPPGEHPEWHATATAWLAQAKAATTAPPSLRRWWNGSSIDAAWLALHRVEVLLVEITPDLTEYKATLIEARQRAKARLNAKDERLVALKNAEHPHADDPTRLRDGTMRAAATALRAALGAGDDKHRQLRDFRKILVGVSVVMLATAIALAVVGWVSPNAISLCWPTDSEGVLICPAGGAMSGLDITLVEFYGFIGAAVTSAIAVRKLRGTSTPYAVPLWSLIVKLPIGAITAVVGLILLATIDVTVASQPSLAAWALVFGVSQEAITGLIDRQAQTVLNSLPSSADSGTVADGDGAA